MIVTALNDFRAERKVDYVIDIKVYSLPTQDSPPEVIEEKYVALTQAYRRGEELAEVELDWMDTANTWLIQLQTNNDLF